MSVDLDTNSDQLGRLGSLVEAFALTTLAIKQITEKKYVLSLTNYLGGDV